MRVIVLGGSGQLGSRLAVYFRERGHEVVTTSRSGGHAAVANSNLPLVRFDPITDPWLSLGSCEILINTIGAMSDDHEEMRLAHIAVPEQIARHQVQLGAPYVIHLSALGARVDHPTWFLQSKAIGDALLIDRLGSRLCVVRPSIVCTPGTRIVQKIKTLRNVARYTGGVLACPRQALRCKLQPVLIEDLAAIFYSLAIDTNCRSTLLNVGGQEQYTLQAMLEIAMFSERFRLKVLPLPLGLCRCTVACLPRRWAQNIASCEEFQLLGYDNILPSVNQSNERSHIGNSTRNFFEQCFAHG